uniref:hypothetical protein n=1 Tax=Bradyrhizobium sp. (strain ORS 278) TaxID=114615 RepID=UPI000A03D14C|nr:hypothetical protein [Bradyrhizobium sp. ORS 278]
MKIASMSLAIWLGAISASAANDQKPEPFRVIVDEIEQATNSKARTTPESPSPNSDGQIISKAVKGCVAQVRNVGKCTNEQSCPRDAEFFRGFDAYYNPASGQVENNVTVQGERKALFTFKKCMAESGVALK